VASTKPSHQLTWFVEWLTLAIGQHKWQMSQLDIFQHGQGIAIAYREVIEETLRTDKA